MDLAQVDQHASLADPRERDEVAMSESRSDLARLDEADVRSGNVAGLEELHHREPVLEVPLLDAVDVRFAEEPRGTVHPASATAEVSLEAESLRDSRPEVHRPVHRVLVDAPLVRADPVGEGLLVVAGEVRGGGESVEVVDVEVVELEARERRNASPHRWSS